MTELDPVDLTVSVSCDSAVRFALQGVDNTGDSAYTAFRYGLGRTADDEKIGSATIGLKGISIDSANGFATTSYDGGATVQQCRRQSSPHPDGRHGRFRGGAGCHHRTYGH